MPRRFTDTDKWRDEWWGSLDNDYRMIWLYLVDSCSIAGIWKKDFRGLNFNCNTNISEVEFLATFGTRIIDKGNYFFIPKFLRYQCPKGLNSNKPAILSIVKELEQNNLIQTVHESLGNDFLIIKGKGTGKGIGKDKVKEKTKEPEIATLQDYEFWTEQIVDGADHDFEVMFMNSGIPQSPNIQFWIMDHRDLLSRYPKMRPPNQYAFRNSCLKHIRENYKKPTNGKSNSITDSKSRIDEIIKNRNYSGGAG